MIELRNDVLRFSFPDVHKSARFSIDLQRTLRIPDRDDEIDVLPPGLGPFPLRHVDDGTERVPAAWLARGGVMLPMHQAEAMWISFTPHFDDERRVAYPFAVRIAAGKINAVTGQQWTNGLHARPQDYVVAPRQPWLDGFCVAKGVIRQFVAMPLGRGYTAEEQITGAAEHGGVQIVVYPMKREAFERRFPKREAIVLERLAHSRSVQSRSAVAPLASAMGLAPGGRMNQTIYDDPFEFGDWDQANTSRCFVHIANAESWRALTGEAPPTTPPSAADYTNAGLPWFDFYAPGAAVEGSAILSGLESVLQMGKQKGEAPLPENEAVSGERVVRLGRGRAGDQVREGTF